MTHRIGYFVGSLSSASINRSLANALIRLAPAGMEFHEIQIGSLPLYNRDLDSDYPAVARAFKSAIEESDGLLFVTPEYNRALPGVLKNAIDWGSRPWGTNSFKHKPSAVIGASTGKIGTAVAQQNLRSVLSFLAAPQLNAPEAYIQLAPGVISPEGEVSDAGLQSLLVDFIAEFDVFVERVLMVLPAAPTR